MLRVCPDRWCLAGTRGQPPHQHVHGQLINTSTASAALMPQWSTTAAAAWGCCDLGHRGPKSTGKQDLLLQLVWNTPVPCILRAVLCFDSCGDPGRVLPPRGHLTESNRSYQTTIYSGRGFLFLQQWELRGAEPLRSLPTGSHLGCCQTPSAGTRREVPEAGERVSSPGDSHVPALNPRRWEGHGNIQ